MEPTTFTFTLRYENKILDVKAVRESMYLSLHDAVKLVDALWATHKTTLNQVLSDQRFTLTGSRFFDPANVSNSTDWDFFIDGSQVTVQELHNLNFSAVDGLENYRDEYLHSLWFHKECNIHIQVYPHKAHQAKLKAQNLIKAAKLQRSIDKRHNTRAAIADTWSGMIDYFLTTSNETEQG